VRKGRDDNPFRSAFFSSSVLRRRRRSGRHLRKHAEYFFHKLLYNLLLSGDPRLSRIRFHGGGAAPQSARRDQAAGDEGQGLLRPRFLVVGSPKTVRERLLDDVKQLRMGHLLALLHFGSMPTESARINIICLAARSCPICKTSGRINTKIAGGRAPAAKRPAPAMAAAS